MNRMDKILEYFTTRNIDNERKAISTTEIANFLEIYRTDVSTELNKLVKQGILVKCGLRPVLYYLAGELTEDNLENDAFNKIIGSNGSIKAQIDLAKAAISYPPHGLHTLICGESGVGKSLLAESMANYAKEIWKDRKSPIPFITFSCADYADNAQLLITQLFGYVKGAFTGAMQEHEGVVDRAQGGILFLDEIHRLPPTGQELLFILIDKGFYRRLGETKTEHTSNLMLIGATSENVDSSLLLTFKRRIPVQINLPNIMQRPIDERLNLIIHFFKQESIRLQYPIQIEGKVIELFAKYNCPANIGELKNDIVLCCAKGYLNVQAHNKEQLEISVADLPGRIFTHLKHQTILDNTINQIFINGITINPGQKSIVVDKNNYGIDFYKYIDRKIENYRQLGMSDKKIGTQTKKDLEQYFQAVMKGLRKDKTDDIPTSIIEKHIWETANILLEEAAVNFNRIYNRNILAALAWHLQQFKERVLSGRIVYNTNLENVRYKYSAEFDFISQKVNFISERLNVDVSLDEIGFLAMFFTHDINKINEDKIGIIVAAHGRATAQNLAEVTNNLLGTEHINSYDIPLNQDNTKTINDLVKFIKRVDCGKGVLILVDMGFLVTMENTLCAETNVKIRIIPNVTTALVLEAGRQVLTNDDILLDEIVNNIYISYDVNVLTTRNLLLNKFDKEKRQLKHTENVPKSILLICMSGYGVAEKIKEILLENIPQMNKIKLITAGINDDIDAIYTQEKNSICMVIGTSNPHIPIVPFINISDLFLPEGLSKIKQIITNKVNEDIDNLDIQYKELYQILREQLDKFICSLSKEETANCCEKIIGQIVQNFFNGHIEQDSIVRLYLHLACMFDRVNSHQELKEPDWAELLKKSRQKEYMLLEKIVNSCAVALSLHVSSGELCYFLNGLPEMKIN